MKPDYTFTWCVLVLTLFGLAPGALAGQRTATGSLRITVHDPSGAVVPAALVQVRGTEDPTVSAAEDVSSDAVGVANAQELPPGKYSVTVSFPGFETRTVPDIRVRAGDNRRDVTLAIQKVDQAVSVGRDPAVSASDPNSDRFNTVLSKEQIDALPDDPDEMEKVLNEMAGPGATIRVDGFRGGRLPPKSQIRSIRFSRDMFAAENHGGGMVFVDIVTQPGLGPLRAGLDFTFRDGSLNARNAFADQRQGRGKRSDTFNLSGTLLKDPVRRSRCRPEGASLYDSANVFAALPDGSRSLPIRRPSDRINVNARIDHALTKAQTLRATFQQNQNEQRNLGVGNFDLSERAYRRLSDDRVFRLSESGPWSRHVFAESRFQLHWLSTDAASASEVPTVLVLDAFTAGGAQQAGGRNSTEMEWATNVDWATAKHAVRAGALEGGSYRSDSRTNYLGTYTFTSLADYAAGRPATYTRRTGDPLVGYSQWQAGLFVQDDWRARKSLTISGGVRQEMQTHMDDRWNLAPRAGFTWSPFKSGKTTVRGGTGVFYDWLDADTFEQTLRVDGVRQQDVVVRNPGYPNPFSGGPDQQVLPAGKYTLAGDVVMPKRAMVNLGLSRQLSSTISANVSVNRMRGTNRLRGRNINAPLADGSRPDPLLGNITQVESTARLRGQMVNAGLNLNMPARRTMLFANYSWIRQENDADGPFSLPANSYDLAGEWGPAPGVPHHIVSGIVNTTLLKTSASDSRRPRAPVLPTASRPDATITATRCSTIGPRASVVTAPSARAWWIQARGSATRSASANGRPPGAWGAVRPW